MANFLEYIEEDIQSKKILFSSMPVNTKTNKRKFNAKIDEVYNTYKEYKKSIKKYIELKSKSFNVIDNRNTADLSDKISRLENIRFILNPSNTYFEKMGFDTLFYQISNSQDVNFSSLSSIFNEFINKFEMVNIKLNKNDFNYTYYVNQFMSSFMDIRKSDNKNIDQLTEIFEKIYWENPEIISHIELNFRKLIRKNEKNFTDYINKLKKELIVKNNIDYKSCLNQLTILYQEMNTIGKENVSDIIELAKKGELDVNHFFEESKVRVSTFSSLMLDSLNVENEQVMNKFYESLAKLKDNVEEYASYVKFLPLINDFKLKYLKKSNLEINKNESNKQLKELESQINKKENKLNKLNKKIFRTTNKFFIPKEKSFIDLKIESVRQATELHDLYQKYNEEYFKVIVLNVISNNFALKDLLQLYYSFDYYKKEAIKNSYEINNYDELIEYSDSFDLFALDLTNVIICPVIAFDEVSVARVIINKYRLLNINITNEDLFPENLDSFIERINLILRIQEIEKSQLTIEKLWFIVQVNKYLISESQNK
ncbi:MAG: hypothetical protein PHF30_03080 [Bacilli bacterium]|nr:hypothetical protein [Bacilli bacterium]